MHKSQIETHRELMIKFTSLSDAVQLTNSKVVKRVRGKEEEEDDDVSVYIFGIPSRGADSKIDMSKTGEKKARICIFIFTKRHYANHVPKMTT